MKNRDTLNGQLYVCFVFMSTFLTCTFIIQQDSRVNVLGSYSLGLNSMKKQIGVN